MTKLRLNVDVSLKKYQNSIELSKDKY